MIKLERAELPAAAGGYLQNVTDRIMSAPAESRKAEASRAWSHKSRPRFGEVRGVLAGMCSGVERCMYCEDSSATDIDHFEPKATSPEKAFRWTNYLLACSTCNSNYKRTEYPTAEDGTALLIDPTREDPCVHLLLSPKTGMYAAADGSMKGEASIRVFGLNRAVLATGRRLAWDLAQLVVIAYAEAREASDGAQADRIKAILRHQPFAGVLAALTTHAGERNFGMITPECESAIQRYPETRNWPAALFVSEAGIAKETRVGS